MQYPLCQDRDHLVLELYDEWHASGIVKECGHCGAVWSRTNHEISMLSVPKVSYLDGRGSLPSTRQGADQPDILYASPMPA
jgi:hypothetical protein